MNQHKISERLLQFAQNDLKVRERLMRNDQLIGGYHPEMEKVHRENVTALRQIIKEIGFPGISKVGTEASEAACLIAQHAIAEPAFMKLFFELVTENSWISIKSIGPILMTGFCIFRENLSDLEPSSTQTALSIP